MGSRTWNVGSTTMEKGQVIVVVLFSPAYVAVPEKRASELSGETSIAVKQLPSPELAIFLLTGVPEPTICLMR
jgi:hypothetical protein